MVANDTKAWQASENDVGPFADSKGSDEVTLQQQKPPTSPVPDGGFEAWMIVVSGFITTLNACGFVNCFGVFQASYISPGGLLETYSPSAISWIGSLQTFFVFFPALVIGRIADAGYVRSTVFVGTCIMIFGILMTSIAKPGQYYQFFLAQGVCVGIGLCPIFIPPVTVAAHWFKRKHALSLGIGASGASVGGCLYSILLKHLLPKIGFAWSLRVVALIIGVTQIIPLIFLKPRLPARPLKGQQFLDLEVFHNPVYVLVHLGLFLAFMGLYTPFFNIELFAFANGLSLDLAFYTLPILNAASTIGRILPALIADRFGSLNSLIPCIGTTGCLLFVWMGCTTQKGIITFSVFYGFTSGAFVSLPPAVVAALSEAPDRTGIRVGQMLSIVSVATLIGPPIANAIIGPLRQLRPGGGSEIFNDGAIFAGAVVMGGFATLVLARIVYDRRFSIKI
ncbi:putative MFS monocarboxylate transporter [Protomyces lactucae-debilis]|uniref:Putative MFS monocarboxylate transporter n=1 Tax=Protomyces lactucae-debilis TaxID=2754530 RepID=A0A1Y2FGF8_PROLT|nr:putative MFS monocarboxylate transporter [Protomyces lactucae-debilis]ORY83028.1 putative MFS monocarboxylate transporter [Protomyces lactucae-debilis]